MKKIKLSNQVHVNYGRTDDAVQAFKLAIGNSQARLALEILSDIIDGLVSAIEDIESASLGKVVAEDSPVKQEVAEQESNNTTVNKQKPRTAQKRTSANASEQEPNTEE